MRKLSLTIAEMRVPCANPATCINLEASERAKAAGHMVLGARHRLR